MKFPTLGRLGELKLEDIFCLHIELKALLKEVLKTMSDLKRHLNYRVHVLKLSSQASADTMRGKEAKKI